MSEILSEEQLSAMEDGTCIDLECRDCDVTNRLIASHRSLRTERDALKAELAAAKATIRDFRNVDGAS